MNVTLAVSNDMGMQSPNSKVSHHDRNLISHSLHAIKSDGLLRAYMHFSWSKPEVFLGCGGWRGVGGLRFEVLAAELMNQVAWDDISISYSIFRSCKEHNFIIVCSDFVMAACKWTALAKQILRYSLHGLSWRWRQEVPWLVYFWDLRHWLVVGYWHFRTTYQFHLEGSSSPRRLVVSYWCFRIAYQSWDW